MKIIMKHHLTPVRMLDLNGAGKDVGKREPLCTPGGNVNWHSHYI